MAYEDQLAFLLHELQIWREQGVIGPETYELLRQRYAHTGLLPPPPLQLPLFPTTSPAVDPLERELELQARAELARDPPPEPPLEQELEQEVAVHQRLEQEVAEHREATAASRRAVAEVPPEQRGASLGAAVAEAAQDVAMLRVESPPPTPAQRAVERGSLWSTRLRPFFDENALWLAGGLLVLCGSIYFLRLVWDELSNLALHGLIAGALHAYAAGFFGVGYMLSRRRQAHGVGRILFCFATAILPLGSVAVGELAAQLGQWGPAGHLLGGGGMALALGLQGLMLSVMAGLYERASIKPLVLPGLGLSLLTMLVAPLTPSGAWLPGLCGLGFVALARGYVDLCSSRPGQPRVNLRMSLLFAGGSLLWAFAVLVVRAHLAAPVSVTHYAPLLAALAGLTISCDHRLRLRAGHAPRLSALGLGLYGALVLAVALSVTGLARLGYFDLGARIAVLATSAIAVFFLAQGARRYGRSAMTHLAATTGLLTYFFLPAPFTGLLLLAQRWIHAALGYQDQPLPVAYYGLAFIPYLVGLTVLAAERSARHINGGEGFGLADGSACNGPAPNAQQAGRKPRLEGSCQPGDTSDAPVGTRHAAAAEPRRRWVRSDLKRDLQWFVLILSAVLVPLALASGADLRPMLWTWPIYAAGCFAWSGLFRRRHLVYAGHAIAQAFLWVLGLWLLQRGTDAGPPLLLAGCGVLLGFAAAGTRHAAAAEPRHDGHAHLGHAALGSAALAVVALFAHTPREPMGVYSVGLVALTLALCTVRFRWAVVAQLTALMVFATTIAGCVAWAGSLEAAALAFLLLAVASSVLVHLFLRSPDRGEGRRLVARPATTAALLALGLFLVLAVGGDVFVVWAPGLAALMLLHLCLVSRSWVVALLATAGGAVAVGATAYQIQPESWAPVVGLLSAACLLAGARLAAGIWPRARARGRAVMATSFAVQAVAAVAMFNLAFADGPAHLGWAAVAAGVLGLFCLVCTYVFRRDADVSVVGLICLALSSSAAGALALHHLVGPSTSGAWHLGVLLAVLSLGWALAARQLRRRDTGPTHLGAAALWVAQVLPLVPLLFFGSFLGLALLQCGPEGLLVGLISLQLSWGAMLCMGLCLASALVVLRAGGGQLSAQVALGSAVGLTLTAYRLLLPEAHLGGPLAALAVLLAWCSTRPGDLRRRVHAAWPLCLAPAALLASHLHLHQPHLLLAVASAAGVLFLFWRRATCGDSVAASRTGWLEYGWAAAAVVALQLTVVWLAAELSTGRHPQAAVLAPMAAVALGFGLLLDLLHRQGVGIDRAARVGRISLVLAALLAVAAVVGCHGRLPAFVLGLSLATLAVLALHLPLAGRRLRLEWLVHAAGAVVTFLYLILRTQTGLESVGLWLDGAALLVAAQAALWASHGREEGDPLRRPLRVLAALWPVLSVAVLPLLSLAGAAVLALLVALHYAGMARVLGSRHLTIPSLLFANLALFLCYARVGWSDSLLYALPVCLTLLVLVHVYAAELGASGKEILRGLILAGLYTLGVSRALVTPDALQSLVVVPALCVGGIVVGTLLRIRIYVLMGVGFLAADLLANMVHYGLARPHLGALFLTLLGLLLVAAMVVFSLERERILRRYSAILGELRTWE